MHVLQNPYNYIPILRLKLSLRHQAADYPPKSPERPQPNLDTVQYLILFGNLSRLQLHISTKTQHII